MKYLMQIRCIILNVTATQSTFSLNSIYCPQWLLVQWSRHHSHMQTTSPLSLAARLHRCHANHSHYINNGWTFSGQTSHIFIIYFSNNTISLLNAGIFVFVFATLFVVIPDSRKALDIEEVLTILGSKVHSCGVARVALHDALHVCARPPRWLNTSWPLTLPS